MIDFLWFFGSLVLWLVTSEMVLERRENLLYWLFERNFRR